VALGAEPEATSDPEQLTGSAGSLFFHSPLAHKTSLHHRGAHIALGQRPTKELGHRSRRSGVDYAP